MIIGLDAGFWVCLCWMSVLLLGFSLIFWLILPVVEQIVSISIGDCTSGGWHCLLSRRESPTELRTQVLGVLLGFSSRRKSLPWLEAEILVAFVGHSPAG